MSGCCACYISVSLRQVHIEQDTKILPGGYPAVFQSVRGFISFTVWVPSSSERPQREPFQYVQVQCVKMWHAGVCYGPEREGKDIE